EGSYTLWGYLHLMTGPNSTADAVTFGASLATQLDTVPGSSGLAKSTMQVSRGADGGLIGADYF
ncbi:MAG: hypothetical protein ACOYMN_07950, partial [Roseimicrobium sp.]